MIRPVPETPPFPTKEDWAYILMALGTLHNMQPYYRVEAHVATLAAAQETKTLLDLVTRGKSPCGHWSAYAVTPDGGKHVTCLQCEVAAAQGTARQLEEAQNARAEDQHLLFLLEGKLEQAEAAYAALREQAQFESFSPMLPSRFPAGTGVA